MVCRNFAQHPVGGCEGLAFGQGWALFATQNRGISGRAARGMDRQGGRWPGKRIREGPIGASKPMGLKKNRERGVLGIALGGQRWPGPTSSGEALCRAISQGVIAQKRGRRLLRRNFVARRLGFPDRGSRWGEPPFWDSRQERTARRAAPIPGRGCEVDDPRFPTIVRGGRLHYSRVARKAPRRPIQPPGVALARGECARQDRISASLFSRAVKAAIFASHEKPSGACVSAGLARKIPSRLYSRAGDQFEGSWEPKKSGATQPQFQVCVILPRRLQARLRSATFCVNGATVLGQGGSGQAGLYRPFAGLRGFRASVRGARSFASSCWKKG